MEIYVTRSGPLGFVLHLNATVTSTINKQLYIEKLRNLILYRLLPGKQLNIKKHPDHFLILYLYYIISKYFGYKIYNNKI